MDALTERIAAVNNLAPERNCGVAIFPDLPKDSSLRGLFDEEKALQESFFGLRQHCDTRFIELSLDTINSSNFYLSNKHIAKLNTSSCYGFSSSCFSGRPHFPFFFQLGLPRFDRDKRSLQKSNTRRFGSGRVVVSHDKADDNPWLSTSDLAVNGRPCALNESESGAPTVKLPRGQELLLPENGSPDQDLRLSERLKPSPEQAAAQKGVRRAETLLISLFKGMKLRGPTIIINFTGYVEEFAVAVP